MPMIRSHGQPERPPPPRNYQSFAVFLQLFLGRNESIGQRGSLRPGTHAVETLPDFIPNFVLVACRWTTRRTTPVDRPQFLVTKRRRGTELRLEMPGLVSPTAC